MTCCSFHETLSLYHVWCVSVFPSLSYTNMHIPYCFCCGTMFTNKEWEFNLLQGLHSIAQPSFVRVSLSISKLHEHAYSHCSLRKGYCLPTSYQCIGVIALSLIYLFTKFHTSKHLGKGVTQTCMFTLFFCCGTNQHVSRILVSYH